MSSVVDDAVARNMSFIWGKGHGHQLVVPFHATHEALSSIVDVVARLDKHVVHLGPRWFVGRIDVEYLYPLTVLASPAGKKNACVARVNLHRDVRLDTSVLKRQCQLCWRPWFHHIR